MSWLDIFQPDVWDAINCDLQDAGIDLDDDALMRARSWDWLRMRIFGLLRKPPVAFLTEYPDEQTRVRRPQPANRTQALLLRRDTA